MTSSRKMLAALGLAALAAGPLVASAQDARVDQRAAAAAIRLGDFARAGAATARAIAADPANGWAQALAARVALARGDGLAAEGALERAARHGVPAERLFHLRAHALLMQGKVEDASQLAASPLIPPRYRSYALRIAGRAATVSGELPAARRAFDAAVRRTPRDASSWADLARFLVLTGDQPGAIDAVDRALAIDPRHGEALVLKGELARRSFGLAASLPWFEAATEADPGNGPAWAEYAATLGDMGRYTDMLRAARRAAESPQSRAKALYLQAVLAARAGRYEVAREIAGRTGGLMDDVPGMMLLAGALDYRDGSHDQAIRKLGALVELQPSNIVARRLYGAALFAGGDARGAIDALAPLVERAEPDGYAATLAARALESLGDRDRAGVLLDAAVRPARARAAPPDDLAMARKNAERESGSPDVWLVLGDALIAAGNPRGAADAFARAANLRFDEAIALRLIDALGRAGARDEAAETLDLFLQQNPRNLAALRLVADWQMAARQWPAAIETLESLRRRIGHRDGALLAQLAWAHAGVGNAKRALVYAEAAYELAPGSPLAADTYGWLLAAVPGRLGDAHALLAKAVRLAPDNAAIRRHYAAVDARVRRG